MTIWIYTMDGTGSTSATAENGGGGFPAAVASRLVAKQPGVWSWVPIDYQPGFRLQHGPSDVWDMPLCPPSSTGLWPQRSSFGAVENIMGQSGSLSRAVSLVIQHVQNYTRPGDKLVYCGLSQGAWAADSLLDETRFGCLSSRLADLMAVVSFGSPLRPAGHTISLPGAFDPGGQGACPFPRAMTYGTEAGLLRSPPSWAWDMCMHNDAASGSVLGTRVIQATGAIAKFAQYGTFKSLVSLDVQITELLVGLGFGDIIPLLHEIWLWLPFTNGAPILGWIAPNSNPHANYDNRPYDALSGNTTKTAVDLAVEYLSGLADGHVQQEQAADASWVALPAGQTVPPPS